MLTINKNNGYNNCFENSCVNFFYTLKSYLNEPFFFYKYINYIIIRMICKLFRILRINNTFICIAPIIV